ncbi:LysR family transcriptional regulator [Alteromonas gracilis]|uniref:LysR family transcriptional regulator n=1 Tax=Alteromonas gracilis TaxID=1479524 RepID=UPI0030CC8441
MKQHKKLERLILFNAVAETLNYGVAAERLDISRGYLSEQIKALESALGTKLLQRSTRHVHLTSEGQRVYADTQKIVRSLVSIEQNLIKEQSQLKGKISLTAPNLFAHFVLGECCYAFIQNNPEVLMHIDTSYQRHDLNKGHFDIAFRATSNPPQDMVAKPLFNYSHVIVASPDYRRSKGVVNEINDFTNHACFMGPDQESWTLNKKRVPVSGALKLNDNLSLIEHVLKGRGVCRLPTYAAAKYIKEGALEVIFKEEQPARHTLYIIHPQRLHQSMRMRAFIDTLASLDVDGCENLFSH